MNIREILAGTSVEHPIKSRDIIQQNGLTESQWRSLRDEFSQSGEVGCSSDRNGGYYLVQTDADLSRAIAECKSRARREWEHAERLETVFRDKQQLKLPAQYEQPELTNDGA